MIMYHSHLSVTMEAWAKCWSQERGPRSAHGDHSSQTNGGINGAQPESSASNLAQEGALILRPKLLCMYHFEKGLL